jgi:drug/metabolite transporter (DMT)-like permease
MNVRDKMRGESLPLFSPKTASLFPYLWMLLGAFAFASMGAFAHSLKARCDWQVIALARAIVPLFVTGAMVLAAGVRVPVWRPISLWVRSIAGSGSLICTFYALTRPSLNVSDVLTLTNLFPIWVALLSWPLLNIVPTGEVWLATLLGIVGVGLIQQPHFAQGEFALFLALGSSFFSAVAMIGLHKLHEIDSRAIVAHFSAVSLAIVIGAYFPLPLDFGSLGLLLGVGVSATFGQLFLTMAFTTGHPAKVSVVGLTQVGFGMLFDILVWGRRFSPVTLAGIVLVILPTAWIMLRQRREVPAVHIKEP